MKSITLMNFHSFFQFFINSIDTFDETIVKSILFYNIRIISFK